MIGKLKNVDDWSPVSGEERKQIKQKSSLLVRKLYTSDKWLKVEQLSQILEQN